MNEMDLCCRNLCDMNLKDKPMVAIDCSNVQSSPTKPVALIHVHAKLQKSKLK